MLRIGDDSEDPHRGATARGQRKGSTHGGVTGVLVSQIAAARDSREIFVDPVALLACCDLGLLPFLGKRFRAVRVCQSRVDYYTAAHN